MTVPSQTLDQEGFEADTEYRAIEAALLETPRGRWFLAEHGRRARRLDTAVLQDAVTRLNDSLRQPPALLGALQREVLTLREMLSDARQALLAKPAQNAGGETTTPHAIIKASEDLHELSWSLQANDISPETCEAIARNASRIIGLAQVQAIEGARARQFAEALETAQNRLSALLETIEHELKVDGTGSAT